MTTSPCVRNCCLDQQDCCLGCGRLLSEILQWQQLTDQQRELIVMEAQKRLAGREASLMRPVADPSE